MENEKIVPREPTAEMMNAVSIIGGNETAVYIWQAMHDAAPEVPNEADSMKVLASGVVRVIRAFRFDCDLQMHFPTIEVEFEPVPVGAPNDAKGWQQRNAMYAAIDAAMKEQP
jgi:hypothetical protein